MEGIHFAPEPGRGRHTGSQLPRRLRMVPGDPARLVVWRNGCIENVPRMAVPGVRLIGRCVILHIRGTPSYYYTGLVTMVTTAVIALMHVHRYTEVDFAAYRAREQRFATAGGLQREVALFHDPVMLMEGGVSGVGPFENLVHGGDPADDVRVAAGCYDVQEIDSARGLASAIPRPAEAAMAYPRRPHRRNDAASSRSGGGGGIANLAPELREWQGGVSIGPLPHVSLERRHVISAFLGRDPRSTFYSLLQDPYKELVDLQHLRIFVRQYLVHISAGNKARRVPLCAFVMARGACPMVEADLLRRVAWEELETLLTADQRTRNLPRRAPAGMPQGAAQQLPTTTNTTNTAAVVSLASPLQLGEEADIVFTIEPAPAEVVVAAAVLRKETAPRQKKQTCCSCFGFLRAWKHRRSRPFHRDEHAGSPVVQQVPLHTDDNSALFYNEMYNVQ